MKFRGIVMAKTNEQFLSSLVEKTPQEIKNIYRGIKTETSSPKPHLRELAIKRKILLQEHYSFLDTCDQSSKETTREIDEDPYSHLPMEEQVARKFINLSESANRRGKDFDLSLNCIRELLDTETCFYTGVYLNKKKGDNFQRTIDRVDNTKGYVKGNVVACSHLANQIKNQLFEDPTSDVATNINFMAKLIVKMYKTLEKT
jgi:hypothetical protein